MFDLGDRRRRASSMETLSSSTSGLLRSCRRTPLRVGLSVEPFVGGADAMIECITSHICQTQTAVQHYRNFMPMNQISNFLAFMAFIGAAASPAHDYGTSHFRVEPRNCRFPFLGKISYNCSVDNRREEVCSGQAFLVSPCTIVTSDHIALSVNFGSNEDHKFSKTFYLGGESVIVEPKKKDNAYLSADNFFQNAEEDWALMSLPPGKCLGQKYGWADFPAASASAFPINAEIWITSVKDNDPSYIIRSTGAYKGMAPNDVLLKASASMRPGQSGGLVTSKNSDGHENVIGMVEGAKPYKGAKMMAHIKKYYDDYPNLFVDISGVMKRDYIKNALILDGSSSTKNPAREIYSICVSKN